MTDPTYKGSCFCGDVEITVTGTPVGEGYCHCASCRQWSAAPVNEFTLWKPASVQVTRGADRVGTYHKTDRSFRKFCMGCGGHLMTEHPQWNLIDVYAAMIPGHRHDPHVHVNYQETVMHIHDGLPKMRDLPSELGGSGELMAE